MYRSLLVLLVASTVLTGTDTEQLAGRIIGGKSAAIKDHPFQVFVRITGNRSCGGSIISNILVLTAAHCILDYFTEDDYSIQYGVTDTNSNKNIIEAKKLISHEKFNRTTYDYDIALIVLKTPIPFDQNAQRISLTSRSTAAGTKAIVTGWGITDKKSTQRSDILKSVNVVVFEKATCQKQYKEDNAVITNRMLCAGSLDGSKDACLGDSGGPLVANGKLVGIVSWGTGCARAKFPGVYSNIANLRDWVLETILKNNL